MLLPVMVTTLWCEVCEKWVSDKHATKHGTNYLSPTEQSIPKFWTTD